MHILYAKMPEVDPITNVLLESVKALANMTDEQVATVLRDAVEPSALLKTVVSRITLDPDTHGCQIHYQLPMW